MGTKLKVFVGSLQGRRGWPVGLIDREQVLLHLVFLLDVTAGTVPVSTRWHAHAA